jgi:gluconate 2-dehydrogenase gamma chain
MAGQNFERREILRMLATAAVAAQFPGFSRWAFACEHVSAAVQIKPAEYKPQFFGPAEYANVARLTELIIPTDETPGAREAGVAEFIDFMVWSDSDLQYPFRTGLAWLDANSERLYSKKFADLSQDQQAEMLTHLAFKDHFRNGEEDGREFFRLVREYTVMGFYTTKIGMQELDNPALRFYNDSPGCPHQGDPEHRNLHPPPQQQARTLDA